MAAKKLAAALAATQERPNDLALAREYLALVREHNVRVSADVCRVGALAVARQKELAADERTCAHHTTSPALFLFLSLSCAYVSRTMRG